MPGFVRAVAFDLDGTLAEHDRLSEAAMSAISEIRDDGVCAILITGRILSELDKGFPGLTERFDAVVVENGGVVAVRDNVRNVTEPVEEQLALELARRKVALRRGRVLLAGRSGDAQQVVAAVGALGLDCQIVHNRHELMVLPAGVSKGTGLLAALDELGISPHNVIAVGDAENDLALLNAAEVGVAVANAVPSVRDHADLVLEQADGEGIAALLRGPIISGEQLLHPARRRITIGEFADGTPATVPGAQANVLVCGNTGAGKSYVAGLMIEGWIAAGYTVLVIDMEGDHLSLGRLHNTVVLDNQPSGSTLLSLLRQHGLSVVLDVSALTAPERLEYLQDLPALIEAERTAWGLPHWIVTDEAHVTLAEGGIAAEVFRPTDRGYCLVTFHPEQLCSEALALIDVSISVDVPGAVYGDPRRLARTASLREAGSLERPFVVGRRRTPHVRHRQKYAVTPLSEARRFCFRRPDGSVVATASDLAEFCSMLREVDPNVLAHHLQRGDFSRWIVGAIQDRDLGAAFGAVERNALARRASDLLHARERLLDEIDSRYLTSA